MTATDSEILSVILHGSLQGKLDQLEDRTVPSSIVRTLAHGAATILAVEVGRRLESGSYGVLVPIMRSGLSMVDGFLDILIPAIKLDVRHLGLYRDPATLEAVEYYNNLPTSAKPAKYGIIVDPLLATGSTVTAAIQSLVDWKVEKIIVVAFIATNQAIARIQAISATNIEVVVGRIEEVDDTGHITPGVGDMGDRLYLH